MITKRYLKKKDAVEVTFELHRDDLREAALVCETNDWQPVPMTKANRGKGPFRLKVELPKDREVQFRYLVDGDRWENDEAADDYWPNEHGTENSVIRTQPQLV
jgi:1,4-alpha-glucan branching enzyme